MKRAIVGRAFCCLKSDVRSASAIKPLLRSSGESRLMSRKSGVIVLTVVIAGALVASRSLTSKTQTSLAQQPAQSDTLVIQQIEEQWIDADRLSQEQRIQFFEKVLDPDGMHILHDGKTYSNREILDYYKSHPASPKSEDAAHSQIAGMQVRMYGDIGIVNGTTQVPDPQGDTHLVRFTDVFQKRAGKWVAINEQETDVKGTEVKAEQ